MKVAQNELSIGNFCSGPAVVWPIEAKQADLYVVQEESEEDGVSVRSGEMSRKKLGDSSGTVLSKAGVLQAKLVLQDMPYYLNQVSFTRSVHEDLILNWHDDSFQAEMKKPAGAPKLLDKRASLTDMKMRYAAISKSSSTFFISWILFAFINWFSVFCVCSWTTKTKYCGTEYSEEHPEWRLLIDGGGCDQTEAFRWTQSGLRSYENLRQRHGENSRTVQQAGREEAWKTVSSTCNYLWWKSLRILPWIQKLNLFFFLYF